MQKNTTLNVKAYYSKKWQRKNHIKVKQRKQPCRISGAEFLLEACSHTSITDFKTTTLPLSSFPLK